MAKGKFEGSARNQATRSTAGVSRGMDTARNHTQPRTKKKTGGKVWPILLAVFGAVVLVQLPEKKSGATLT